MSRQPPPVPKTAMLSPMASLALLLMTPRAVVTGQPKGAQVSTSKSAGTGVTRFSETIEYSLKVVTQPELILGNVFEAYIGVGAWRPAPFRQWQTTRSPGLTVVTPSPTSMT